MFKNLFNFDGFRDHNFVMVSGRMKKVKDPAPPIWSLIRNPDGMAGHPELAGELALALNCTLSPASYQSYVMFRPYPSLEPRDYYLSKLYQFFCAAALDHLPTGSPEAGEFEFCQSLSTAFPKPQEPLEYHFDAVDWEAVFYIGQYDPDDGLAELIRAAYDEGNRSRLTSASDGGMSESKQNEKVPMRDLAWANGLFEAQLKKSGLTKKRLAEESGVSGRTTQRLLSGTRIKEPNVRSLGKVLLLTPDDVADLLALNERGTKVTAAEHKDPHSEDIA